MNLHTLKITVVDGNGVTIPGAKVYLSDKEGVLPTVQPENRKYYRGITDINGTHTFTVGMPTLNPMKPIEKLGEAIRVQVTGYPDKIEPIKWDTPNSMGVGSQVIQAEAKKTQDFDDVVVTKDGTNKKKLICEQRGGKYIPPSRDKDGKVTPSRCILPPKPKPIVEEKSWWDKNKVWVLAGSGILLTTIIIIAVVASKKDKKK